MAFFPPNNKKIFFGIIVLLVLPLLALFLLQVREPITYNLTKFINQKQNGSKSGKVNYTQFYFVSELKEYKIAENSVNTYFLTDSLQKLGLLPLINLPYILASTTKIPRVSPETIIIKFLPIEQYAKDLSSNPDLKSRLLQNVVDENNNSQVMYVAGEAKSKGREITIPIYINTNTVKAFPDPDQLISGYALLSLFYTFHIPPLSPTNSDPAMVYVEKMGTVRDRLFRLERKNSSYIFLDNKLSEIWNVLFPKVLAACGGTGQCGTNTTVYKCDSAAGAPYAGSTCFPASGGSPCPGFCNASTVCTANGTSVLCAPDWAGAMCIAGCLSCTVSSACTGTPSAPTWCDNSTDSQCIDKAIGTACTNDSTGLPGSCGGVWNGINTQCTCNSASGPTPTPGAGTVACNGGCTLSSQCSGGRTCSGGVCRNSSCPAIASCTCAAPPTSTPLPPATNTPVPPTVPAGCTLGPWTSASCGGGGCPANQMLQTRTASPGGCGSTTQCVASVACPTLTPVPSNTPLPPTPTNTPIIPPPAPLVDLKVNGSDTPPAITSGSTVTATWTTANATTCTAQSSPATNGWTTGSSKATANSGTQTQSGVGGISANTTLTLNCTGPGGSASNSVLVQVVPPQQPPIVSLLVNGTSGPLTVNSGDLVTATWNVVDATSCTSSATTATGNWANGSSKTATDGSHSQTNVGTITTNRTLTITCTNPGGSSSDSVDVAIAAGNAVTVDLKVNGGDGPVTIPTGNNVSVTWTATNATGACTATASVATTGWSGSKNQTGGSNPSVGPCSSNRTLTLTCPGAGGTTSSDSVDVVMAVAPTATPPPDPVVDLKVNGLDSTTVVTNTNITTTWDVTYATSCQASATVGTGNWVNGSAKNAATGQSQTGVGPISSSRTLSLSCQNSVGKTTVDNVPLAVATATPTPAAGQCSAPPPRDPPVTDCATSAADTVNISWQWNTVALANQYQFSVLNSSGTTVFGPIMVAGGSCVSGTCTQNTTLQAGSYRSRIIASSSTAACSASTPAFSNLIDVPLCSSVNPPTVTLLVNGSSGPVAVIPGSTVNVSWTSTDSSVCTASTTSPAAPATTGWSGNKSLSGSQVGVGPINTARSLTLSCQGPDGTATDNVQLTMAALPSCGTAVHDPPVTVCAAPPTNGTISWEWNAVGGLATSYLVTIYDQSTGNPVTNSGTQLASFFTGSGASCSLPGTTCRYTTTHAVGGSYYSIIQSIGGACTTATSLPSNPASISYCPGTINAVAKRISPSQINDCSAIKSSTDYPDVPPGTAGITLSGGQGTKNQTSSAPVTWNNVPAGAAPGVGYILSSTAPAGYILQNACYEKTANSFVQSASVNVAPNDNINFYLGYTLGTPWTRGQNGDMIICQDVASNIPTLANPDPDFVLKGAGGYPGIVTFGSCYDFNGSGTCASGATSVSSTNWLANEVVPNICSKTDWYQYFANKMDVTSLTPIFTNDPGTKTKNNFPDEVNYVVGNLTLGETNPGNGQWNLGANKTLIIFVNGNVNINANITNSGGTFFAIIASGNITVSSNVGSTSDSSTPSLQGLFVTGKSGQFITGQSTAASTRKLIVKGTVIAGGFTLQRDLDADDRNQNTPAEDFVYDPEMLITMPDSFKDLRIKWEEVAP